MLVLGGDQVAELDGCAAVEARVGLLVVQGWAVGVGGWALVGEAVGEGGGGGGGGGGFLVVVGGGEGAEEGAEVEGFWEGHFGGGLVGGFLGGG